jgi:hypothetical protein
LNFVTRLKIFPRRVTSPQVDVNTESNVALNWKAERSGHFGGYIVSGWRYKDLAIWHLRVWCVSDDMPVRSYVVLAGEFYPEPSSSEERFATLRLVALWEANGLEK